MAGLSVVTKENFGQKKKEFIHPVSKPAPNQQLSSVSPRPHGGFSPNYQKSWHQQRDMGLTDVGAGQMPRFTAKGFKGKEKQVKIHDTLSQRQVIHFEPAWQEKTVWLKLPYRASLKPKPLQLPLKEIWTGWGL